MRHHYGIHTWSHSHLSAEEILTCNTDRNFPALLSGMGYAYGHRRCQPPVTLAVTISSKKTNILKQ